MPAVLLTVITALPSALFTLSAEAAISKRCISFSSLSAIFKYALLPVPRSPAVGSDKTNITCSSDSERSSSIISTMIFFIHSPSAKSSVAVTPGISSAQSSMASFAILKASALLVSMSFSYQALRSDVCPLNASAALLKPPPAFLRISWSIVPTFASSASSDTDDVFKVLSSASVSVFSSASCA